MSSIPSGETGLDEQLEAALRSPPDDQALVESCVVDVWSARAGARLGFQPEPAHEARESRRLSVEVSSAALQAASPESRETGIGTEQRIGEAAAPVQVVGGESALNERDEDEDGAEAERDRRRRYT